MLITLPRGFEIDTENLPENFEGKVKEVFAEYTRGTAEDYTFEDKLRFLDLCVTALHEAKDSDDEVMDLLKDRMESDLRDGDFPREEDYYCLEFMQDVYELGKMKQSLYFHEYMDRHEKERREKIIIRIIKAIF